MTGYANVLQAQQHALQLQQLLQQQQSTQQVQQPQQPGTLNQTQAQTQPQQGSQHTSQPTQAPSQAVPIAPSMTQQGLQVAQVTNIAQRSPNTLLTNQALGAPRLTAQQILQLQQQVRPGSQPRQAGQAAGHQLGQQGQILVPSLNGNSSGLNGTLTTSFVSRDSPSSPAAHVTPPRKSATPTNVNSPRITVDQSQPGQSQMGVPNVQVAGNVLARPATNLNYYGTIPGLTPEQLSVLRFMQQQQQQQQQQQEEWLRQQQLLQLQQQQNNLFMQPYLNAQSTGFGSNNPFAPSTLLQPPNYNTNKPTPSFNPGGTYDTHSPSSLANSTSGPSPSPSSHPGFGNTNGIVGGGGKLKVKTKQELNANEANLASLFANRDDGQDTFGNVGVMRYGNTAAGKQVLAQRTGATSYNPFARTQQTPSGEKPFFDI